MDLNRNQIFLAGMVVLLLGVQLRMVDAFVLNDKTSQFLSKQLKKTATAKAENTTPPFLSTTPTTSAPVLSNNRVLRPPKWVGWAFVSVGGVLILHSLAMPRPD